MLYVPLYLKKNLYVFLYNYFNYYQWPGGGGGPLPNGDGNLLDDHANHGGGGDEDLLDGHAIHGGDEDQIHYLLIGFQYIHLIFLVNI